MLVLERIYNKGEAVTTITRSEMKKMLLLCTKNVHFSKEVFSYDQDIYIQKDGVAMGSSLGPVLAGIFMVNLERWLVPKLHVYLRACLSDIGSSFFAVQVKPGACYITGQWGRVHNKVKEI